MIFSRHSDPLPRPIDEVVAALQQRLDRLPAALHPHRAFLTTYLRTAQAVGAAVQESFFEDPQWVERWDVAFADLYLRALDREIAGDPPARPWQLAFGAPPDLDPLRHVLLGTNAHINYDLPQALLAVIDSTGFEDTDVMARRLRDHRRIDAVLAGRVAEEGQHLAGPYEPTLLDRILTPLNRLGTRRFLREARSKVWHNTLALHRARTAGPAEFAQRLAELEALSAAKIANLLQPGQVLLRLALRGFGVALPDHGSRQATRVALS